METKKEALNREMRDMLEEANNPIGNWLYRGYTKEDIVVAFGLIVEEEVD